MRSLPVLSLLLALGALSACDTTKTGNPKTEAPEGLTYLRSKLERQYIPTLAEPTQQAFARASRAFAFALYGRVREARPNLFFSPYSISTALAMTYGGARGTTANEIASALHFELSGEELHGAFNATDTALAKRAKELPESSGSGATGQGFALELTNAMFAQRGMPFQNDYLDLLARHYDSGMYLADFAKQPERERTAINDWVRERTMQRIPEILPENALNPRVKFVLVNTIYFKASWLQRFDAAATAPAPFHANSGDITVMMMHGSGDMYARGVDYQALELAYLSPSVRALFILPDAGKLEAVEARLDDALFTEARAALSHHAVVVQLPRFRYAAGFKLKPALQGLGMRAAFEAGEADLSGMAGMPNELMIDEVHHDAFVSMDEQGTEAAAATAVVGSTPPSAPPPAEFFADRPFIFAIHDEPTGQILFMGRVSAPSD